MADKDVSLQPKSLGGPIKSIEQNLWTVISRKSNPADSGEMSLVHKRKEPFEKDKYELKLFFLLNIGNYTHIYIYSEKERKKLKRFVS